MERPVTSKPRGICKYYNTERGCFAGDKCKFLHGDTEKHTPFDKAKTCRFFADGYCRRGDKCWFLHSTPEDPSSSTIISEDADCSICMEKPVTYGLLAGCSHVFCIQCIRQWRDPSGKSGEMLTSGNIKKCPLCRTVSKFIIPSSSFYPEGHPSKALAIDKYKSSMARVPCKYFQETKSSSPLCPFGRDCFYQHQSDDGTPYVFRGGVERYLTLWKNRRNQHNASRRLDRLQRIFENPLDDLSATMDAIRAAVPVLLAGREWSAGNTLDGDLDEDEDDWFTPDLWVEEDERSDHEQGEARRISTLERLADRMLTSLAAWQDIEVNTHRTSEPTTVDDELPSLEPVSDSESDSTSLNLELHSDPLADNFLSFPFERVEPATFQSDAVGTSEESVPSRADSRSFPFPSTQSSLVINLASEDEDSAGEGGGDDRGLEIFQAGETEILHSSVSEISSVNEVATVSADAPSGDEGLALMSCAVEAEPDDLTSSLSLTIPAASPEHNVDPPFMTDGRGRVVWSSTRQDRPPQRHAETLPSRLPSSAQRRTTTSERHAKGRRSTWGVVSAPPASPSDCEDDSTAESPGRVGESREDSKSDMDGLPSEAERS